MNFFNDINLSNNAYCISINTDRYKYLCKNFVSVGLKPPRLFKGIRWNGGSNTGCVLSHISILKTCIFLNLDYCVVYEDDAYPRENVLWFFEYCRKFIPEDWGILKIGSSSYRGEYQSVNKCFGIMKSGTAYGSHCYIVRREVMNDLCNNMVKKFVPDVAMNYELYSDYKPYVLDRKYQLFIQKNISFDNIISKKGGQTYWFPHPEKPYGITSGMPPPGFSEKLWEDDPYTQKLSVIKYNNRKLSCLINDNVIELKGLKGKLYFIDDKTYHVLWDNNTYCKLTLEKICDGTKYYKASE